jgi:adenylate cyclase
MPTVRRLTAILAADVAGYSRLMGADEEGTHERLKSHLGELVNPMIAEHRGRIVKNIGDGFLAEFASVIDAVRCAAEVQRGMAERNAGAAPESRIDFRIGINLGDVIAEEHDIFGDGVNVAARLEALAEPGGICVSRVVRDQVRDRLDFAFEDLGEQQVKNIARAVRVYRVRAVAGAVDKPSPASAEPMPLLDKPSVAVLAFTNMSRDPEQEFFADGIAEDVITALSRCPWVLVIARNSSFTYKGRAVDVKEVGRELGVRYVLEGSLRKAGDRIRVTAQLVETETAKHVWAERYDRDLTDIFAVQDEITGAVTIAIAPAIADAELRRAIVDPQTASTPGALISAASGICTISLQTTTFARKNSSTRRSIWIQPSQARTPRLPGLDAKRPPKFRTSAWPTGRGRRKHWRGGRLHLTPPMRKLVQLLA